MLFAFSFSMKLSMTTAAVSKDYAVVTTPSITKNKNGPSFAAILEQLPDVPKAMKSTATGTDRIFEVGILEYAREQRIACIKGQLRFQVLHDIGITEKEYNKLLSNPDIPKEQIDNLKQKVEEEVERRYQEYLEHLMRIRGLSSDPVEEKSDSAALQEKADRICALRKMVSDLITKYGKSPTYS
jgi:hypothetical protein